MLARANKVSADLPNGPLPKPANYGSIDPTATPKQLERALEHWCQMARIEWGSLAQQDLRYKRHSFKWAVPASRTTKAGAGSSEWARTWAQLAYRAAETAALWARGDLITPSQWNTITRHQEQVAATATRATKSSSAVSESIKNWAASFKTACCGAQIQWLKNPAIVARK